MGGAERRLAPFAATILVPGYDGSPAAGPDGRGFHGPRGFSFLDREDDFCWSGSLRERVDTLPRGRDLISPRPGRLDLQAAAPPAAYQTGRSVWGSALARSPSRASSLSQASRICPVIEAVSHAALIPKSKEEMADSAVLPGADRILDPGVDPVGGVDIGGLAEPASGVRGPVRGPQGVPPAVPGHQR